MYRSKTGITAKTPKNPEKAVISAVFEELFLTFTTRKALGLSFGGKGDKIVKDFTAIWRTVRQFGGNALFEGVAITMLRAGSGRTADNPPQSGGIRRRSGRLQKLSGGLVRAGGHKGTGPRRISRVSR